MSKEAASRFVTSRLVRFVVVGVAAAGMLFMLGWLLISAGLSPFAGSVIAYVATFLCAYAAQRGWTFGGLHSHAHALPRYFILQVGCAVFSGLVAHVAAAGFGLPPLAISAVMTVAVSAVSYIGSLCWVFPAGKAI
ncbi:GtrA family protein [Mesorhizobium sp. CN5-321]|uniref:GtrA family protein n=1 Tax=Mesorhizobium hunchu TaxID=3157708 RepID=UPI0032B746E6